MAYLLDANVFIQAKNLHYGLDFCPAFWDWLIEGNAAKRVFSIEKVGDEILAGGDQLTDWASDRGPDFFLKPDTELLAALRSVSAWATGQSYEPAAVNTLVANAMIHQDFGMSGTGPMVEIFDDRMEVTNPGLPLIDPLRFIDHAPRSRNEILVDLMRRLGICEERGSGFDKVIFDTEVFQLPAPDIRVDSTHTKVILFSHQKLSEMDRKDKVRACYQHCALLYVSNKRMTNSTLRERFKIAEKDYPIASRIIRDTSDADLIKPEDPESKSKKHARYVPFWA